MWEPHAVLSGALIPLHITDIKREQRLLFKSHPVLLTTLFIPLIYVTRVGPGLFHSVFTHRITVGIGMGCVLREATPPPCKS